VAPVGAAIGQMDKVTQQSAAWVEESASAAQSLKALAQQLVLSFSVFRMSGDAIDR
jgi:methyl-accepting chemotaxis protein